MLCVIGLIVGGTLNTHLELELELGLFLIFAAVFGLFGLEGG